jgi:ATP-dependent RNA helicase RhlB
MNQPQEVYIEPQERTVDTVEQCVYHVGMDEKLGLLLGLLKREPWERILIFCNTKAGVEFVAAKLVGNGYPAEGITGDLPQRKRLQLMEQFKSGTLKILVATDVASRGIHVEDISHVINYDVPQDREDYVHRIGRTARAGKKGNAITLADERWAWHLEAIEGFMGKKIPMAWFDADWLEADLAPRVSRRRTFRERPEGGRRERRPSSRGQGPRPRGRQAAPRPRPEAPPQPKEPTAAQKPRRRRSRGRREKPGEAAQGASPAAPPPGTHE